MPIPRSGSVNSGKTPPNGIQAAFTIKKTEFRPEARYGPDFAHTLEMVDERYFGIPAMFWTSIQQPRMDLVRKWRKDKMKDKTIAAELRDRGFEFDKVDDPDVMEIGRGGNTYKLVVACSGGDREKAEEVLDSVDSFEELAEWFANKTFVATTKLKVKTNDAGETRSFVNVNGEEDIFPYVGPIDHDGIKAEAQAEIDEDAEDLPDAPWKTPDEEEAA